MKSSIYKWIAAVAILLPATAFFTSAWATCTTSNQYSGTSALRGVNYSAGPDMAVGSTIYRQVVPGYANVTYTCTGANPRLTFSLSGGTLIPGTTDTYSVGLAGLGVKIYAGSNESATQASSSAPIVVPLASASGTVQGANLNFFLTVVKIGAITAGSAGSSALPQVKWDVTDDSGTPARFAYTNWANTSFTINVPTCTTPDFTFNLGSTLLSNSVTSSSWVNTPVTLTGCSTFYGNSSDRQSYQSVENGANGTWGNISQSGTFAKNIVTMTLSPQITPTDSTLGILANQSGSGFAGGVGVQLATQSGSTYTPVNLANNIVFNPALGTSAVSFPLAARMIKTGDVITPGAVSTSVTYTITYQ
ncbi:fimbrial protein [Enterobacter chengduensis]|uniref:fimbrial protein n=1 Tax=Enterobacter chengduensis TaxID=2494701 RepID=UPI002003CFF7|nr:hypothetical protein [Enterobacter chengduensis]MCK7430821.1 hypothetical protein [Enterobacter chengduensis]